MLKYNTLPTARNAKSSRYLGNASLTAWAERHTQSFRYFLENYPFIGDVIDGISVGRTAFYRYFPPARAIYFLLFLLFLLESSYFVSRKALIKKRDSVELLGIGWGRISFGAVIR